jgi:hypothetical protein
MCRVDAVPLAPEYGRTELRLQKWGERIERGIIEGELLKPSQQ